MTNINYPKVTTGLIGGWFLFALSASALDLFKNDGSRPPLAFGLAVAIPLAAFGIWFGRSEKFRQFALSLSPRALTLTQTLRILGYVFLILYSYAILPGFFALPAGWGDIFIGVTAPWAALQLTNANRRNAFVLWQALGVFDLVLALTMGTAGGLIAPHDMRNTALTVLPLSLIPTFAVPLFLMLHFICIAQARRWRDYTRVGARLAAV